MPAVTDEERLSNPMARPAIAIDPVACSALKKVARAIIP
jgi:hypothetical protein